MPHARPTQESPAVARAFAAKLLEGHPYAVVRAIGAGAMGEVFEIEHKTMGRRLVLKSTRLRLGADPHVAERMRIEAQAAARVSHPNIVNAVDFWISPDGFPCFVMELLSGASLAVELRQNKRLPILTATKYAVQALSALAAVHELGVVHRDIKPENLFVCRVSGRVPRIKVLDFGIARVLPDASTGAPAPLAVPTVTGAMVGTPRFMSPEALNGRRVDLRADIYSLGIVLYVMLAGTGPFDLAEPGQHLDAPPPPSRWLPSGFPSELDRIVIKAIREQPADRYQSAADFAEDLKRLRSDLKQTADSSAY